MCVPLRASPESVSTCPRVHPPCAGAFQEKAAEVLGTFRRSDLSSSPVLSFSELHALCAGVCADESTLCMALLQLQRDKQVLVCLQDGEKVTPPPPPPRWCPTLALGQR